MSTPNTPATLGFEKKYKKVLNSATNYLHKFTTDLSISSAQKLTLQENLALLRASQAQITSSSQEIKSSLTQKQHETEDILKIKNELSNQVKD
jgi:chromosome segregation ATPase